MKKVLQIFGEPLDVGGQESFIMNMYRSIDRQLVQFDFFTPFGCTNENLRREIESMGGKVFESLGRFDGQGDKGDFVKHLTDFLKDHKYDTVHIHSGSIFSLAFGAKIAKKSGAKKVIVHSHATGHNNLKYKLIKAVSPFIFKNNVTDYCACSEIAAKWKFPKSVIAKKQYTLIPNGIDTAKFTFSQDVRNKYRSELGLEDCFVICHTGRLSVEKNHGFLIEVFKNIKSQVQNSKLLLIGDGPERQKISETIKNCGLENDVLLLGKRTDISELLQASDVFLFPSVFEGLGIVAIESQATGLPTICSEGIPQEVAVTDLFKRITLEQGAQNWAKAALDAKNTNREHYADIVKQNNFDATVGAKCLLDIYLGK